MERHHRQAEIQIFAEPAGRHLGLQIAVGGGQHAHVHVDRLARSDALEILFLQHAEQFGLQAQVDFGDFVEQDRAAVGRFEAADALRYRPR